MRRRSGGLCINLFFVAFADLYTVPDKPVMIAFRIPFRLHYQHVLLRFPADRADIYISP